MGFPSWKPEYRSVRPRFALLATGVAPRVPLEVWLTQRITLYFFEVRENFYQGDAPHWPDEEAENVIKYPVRFGIEPLAVIRDVLWTSMDRWDEVAATPFAAPESSVASASSANWILSLCWTRRAFRPTGQNYGGFP